MKISKDKIQDVNINYKTFTSPFPRTKSNCELIKSSRVINTAICENDKILLEVPANITKSYMTRNSFYFDIKKVKNQNNKFDTARNKSKPINRMVESNCVFDKKLLENLIQYNGASEPVDSLLTEKTLLLSQKDKFKGLDYNKNFKHDPSNTNREHLVQKILMTKENKKPSLNLGIVPK